MSLSAATTIVFAALVACLTGCVDAGAARRVLADDGYTDIVLAKHSGLSGFFGGCDRERQLVTPFEATVTGHRVKGVVCSSEDSSKAPQVRRYD